MSARPLFISCLIVLLPLSGTFASDGVGHCNYTLQNMFAGPYRVCRAGMTQAQCTEIGVTDENRDAVYGPGGCDTTGAVYVCRLPGGTSEAYYEGDPAGLDIGCGFQGGEGSANATVLAASAAADDAADALVGAMETGGTGSPSPRNESFPNKRVNNASSTWSSDTATAADDAAAAAAAAAADALAASEKDLATSLAEAQAEIDAIEKADSNRRNPIADMLNEASEDFERDTQEDQEFVSETLGTIADLAGKVGLTPGIDVEDRMLAGSIGTVASGLKSWVDGPDSTDNDDTNASPNDSSSGLGNSIASSSPQNRPQRGSTNCETAKPAACRNAEQRGVTKATEIVRRSQARDANTGASQRASDMWCVGNIALEANRYCAVQYRKAGMADCASIYEAQAEATRQARDSAARSAAAFSAANMRERCSWE